MHDAKCAKRADRARRVESDAGQQPRPHCHVAVAFSATAACMPRSGVVALTAPDWTAFADFHRSACTRMTRTVGVNSKGFAAVHGIKSIHYLARIVTWRD